MSNLRNNNRHNLRLHIDNSEYWDFFVDKSDIPSYDFGSAGDMYDKCLISYIDMEDPLCRIEDDCIASTTAYTWENAVSTGHTFENIGYTGVDNGLIRYRKDRISNDEFVEIYTKSKFKFEKDDFRLKLHPVSGNTLEYSYPYEFTDDSVRLNGGFFQGIFRDECDTYDILPHELEDSWHFEFTIKPEDIEEPENSVNSKHPENKGIFFFMGLRAENKWQNIYTEPSSCTTMSIGEYVEGGGIDMERYGIDFRGEMITNDETVEYEDALDGIIDYETKNTLDEIIDYGEVDNTVRKAKSEYDGTKCDGDCDYVAEETDITGIKYETSNGISIGEANQYAFTTDNKFLIFDRTKDGFRVSNWEEGTAIRYIGQKRELYTNPFLLYNRSRTGYRAIDRDIIPERAEGYTHMYDDIYDNGIAFRVKEDGSIGYRMVTKDCDKDGDDKTKVIEGYSNPGVVRKDEWNHINVRMRRIAGKMCLYFYSEGKLKYVTDELPLISLRKLEELPEKQEGVAYNISLGGGTQGLMETIMPNYMIVPDESYPIENAFAGSFIGEIKTFRFYNCSMEQLAIRHNAEYEIWKMAHFAN